MKIMKSRLLFFALLLAFCMEFCFGMAKVRNRVQIEGIVEYYGNGLFSHLGLKDQDGTLYYLSAEKDMRDKLGNLSGNMVLVNGILTGEKAPAEIPNAVVIRVESFSKE